MNNTNAVCSFCLTPIPAEPKRKQDYCCLGEVPGVCICARCVEDASLRLKLLKRN